MSLYFAKGKEASFQSKHSTMPNGFSAFPQSRFPDEKPPTLFHPASPKIKAAKPVDDNASMMSTSTFASTVSLLKEKVNAKFSKNKKQERNSSEPSARAQTAEAYRIIAMTK